jgi:hypothetical protein
VKDKAKGLGSNEPQFTCAAGGEAITGDGKTVICCVHVVVQVMGNPVCGLIGATVSVIVNVIFVVPEFVNEKVGFCADVLLIVEVPVPPVGGETVQVYCKARGTPLQLGGVDVLFDETFNTEHPDVGVRVKAQVGGSMTHSVSVSISSPHEFLIR